VLSTAMSDQENPTPPFDEKQVQAHGWINILKITEEIQNLINQSEQDKYFVEIS
jgi:hypothetical protein